MLSLTTIGLLLSTPALTMLFVSFAVSLFERKKQNVAQDLIESLNA